MRNLMLMGVLLAVIVGVVGFRQGWFQLTTTRQAGSGNLDVHLKVDADKAKADAKSTSHIK